MSDVYEQPSSTRRIRLPSGRQIEVLYYEPVEDPGEQDLGPCGRCACALVRAGAAEPVGASHWQVLVRCPNCLWAGTSVVTESTLERFEQRCVEDISAIRSELAQIELANMIGDAERFVRALDENQILPSDF
ncbi:MAG: hypothetical protein ACR2ND_13510 [Solirubrobacteraceae bacterium]